MTQLQRQEIKRFLEQKRNLLKPQDVGLPSGNRRRTPGLRREEVAFLAHVSVSWYTKFEQGQAAGLSLQAINGIARALKLTPAEHAHLLSLANLSPHIQSSVNNNIEIEQQFQVLIDKLDPFPAFIIDRQWNFIAWNSATISLYGDFSKLPTMNRNALWFTFMDKEHKSRVQNWIDQARSTVAAFRAATAGAIQEPWFKRRINELIDTSPDFALIWKEYSVERYGATPKHILTKSGKKIMLSVQMLSIEGNDEFKVVVQIPQNA